MRDKTHCTYLRSIVPGSIASAPFTLAMGEVVSVPCEGKDMHTEIRAPKCDGVYCFFLGLGYRLCMTRDSM